MTEDRAEFMYHLGKAFPRLEWIELLILAAYGEGLCAAGSAQRRGKTEEGISGAYARAEGRSMISDWQQVLPALVDV